MAITKESTPPPVIGKVGRYTVFMTPPATPKPAASEPKSQSPKNFITTSTTTTTTNKIVAPPVQPPPQQFDKTTTNSTTSSNGSSSHKSPLDFFWNAVSTVQNAHMSLDEYLAGWFGLDNSKYQWALDDYYESKGMEKGNAKRKDQTTEGHDV